MTKDRKPTKAEEAAAELIAHKLDDIINAGVAEGERRVRWVLLCEAQSEGQSTVTTNYLNPKELLAAVCNLVESLIPKREKAHKKEAMESQVVH